MAVARVTLVCPTCGAEFTKTKTCYNRKEADRWEEYMTTTDMECPECYKARMAAETEAAAAEIIAKFGMPEITGASDKQIKYANDLRNKYLLTLDVEKVSAAVDRMKEMLANGEWEQGCAKVSAKSGASVAKVQYNALRAHGIAKLVVLMHTTDAHTLIDMLSDEMAWIDATETVVNAAAEAVNAIAESIKAETEAAATEDGNDNNANVETTTDAKKTTYDKSAIMRSAWAKKKAAGDQKTFGECLREAWAEAKKAAGVDTTATKRTRRSSKTTNAVYAY